jgi:hypothetical protein
VLKSAYQGAELATQGSARMQREPISFGN